MQLDDLPIGWYSTTLDDVADWGSGGTPSRKESAYYNGNIPWIKTGDLGPKVLYASSEYISELGIKNSSAKHFPKGSVAIAMYGATIGKTSILGIDATTNQACGVGYPVPGLTFSEFLYYFLLNEKDEFIAKGKGGAQPNISQALIKEHEISLPPLAEQKVIADKLDTLLAQVETTKARLERIPNILKRFRQSVLAAAVSGKLTEKWRANTKQSDMDALIAECTQHNTSTQSLKFANKAFRADEIELKIPTTWKWVRLARISEVVSGIAKGSKTKEESVTLPYLRVANVQRGFLDLEDIKEISAPKSKAENLKLKLGDILFNEGGDIDKLGRGWIWENQISDCIHQNHVFRARCYSNRIQPKYISFFGNSEGKEYFLREGTQSVNLANINKTTLSLLPIPLPPPEEQAEIVRRVEKLFTLADTIEQKSNAALERVNSLTQSILAKAFRGELTTDWRAANPGLISGENSAEALLARIKAEREALKPKKMAKKKSPKRKSA